MTMEEELDLEIDEVRKQQKEELIDQIFIRKLLLLVKHQHLGEGFFLEPMMKKM
jgi:hypothetical protein